MKLFLLTKGKIFQMSFNQLLADYWVFAKKNKIKFYPTVMADENQRIKKDENTTIQEMEDIFGAIPGALDLYQKRLLNEIIEITKEIAEVGRRFYPGLKTGVPEIPSKRGDKPTFFWVNSRTELAERIINYKVNNPTKTVGVLIPQQGSGKPVEKYVVALRQILKKRAINQKKIFVQYYLSKHREINTEDLNFDSSNSITVLTNQSAKGLEFDAVFIPDLEQLDTVGEFSANQ
jgi:DNA helicase-2/ATP-dependent DNA helicase PcrA